MGSKNLVSQSRELHRYIMQNCNPVSAPLETRKIIPYPWPCPWHRHRLLTDDEDVVGLTDLFQD